MSQIQLSPMKTMTLQALVIYIIYVFLLCCCIRVTWGAFTCQGSSYNAALNACPDGGAQKMSSGGNVTIRVYHATNLLNKDNSGPSSKVSDPYVRFTSGNVSVRTSTVRNSLNPQWNEYVSLGFLGSATEISVEIWDADSGIEFADDLIARTTVRVPFCSMFSVNKTTLSCDDPFDCVAYDSLWRMPNRKVCNETGFVNFFPSKHSCASGKGTCLFFEFLLVPFQMDIEVTYPSALVRTPVVSAIGSVTKSWTSGFGFPFLGSSLALDPFAVQTTNIRGALMLRTSNADKSFGKYNAIKFYATVNFPATIYVCRYEEDNANGVPSWILSEYSSRLVSIYQLLIRGTSDQFFGCFYKEVDGTRKNEWGGVESGAMAFRTNTLQDLDSNTVTQQNFYSYNYIVLAVPRVAAPRDDRVTIVYDMELFLGFFGSYGLIWIWFFFLTAKFLHKINFRIDRLSNYVATRVLTGENSNVLAGLLLNINQSPCNVEYRSHLYHAKNILVFCIFLPIGLLMSWGMSVAVVVRPAALGIGLFFIGSALIFLWFAARLWETSHWRLSSLTVSALSASFASFCLFFIVALFVDPGVLHYDYALDIAGLSLIFGTLNCVPCILLIFKHDRSMSLYLELVVTKLAEAVYTIKNPNQPNNAPLPVLGPKDLQINRVLHGLLGDKYSINPKLPALKYSGVMDEIRVSFNSMMNNGPNSQPVDEDEEQGMLERLLTEERKLYGAACFVLFIYFVIAAATTASPSLAFLNICALVLLDIIHLSMSKGDNSWSPGFKTLLLILGRMLICGSTVSLWMLNYSACYMLYAITIIHELIQGVLPTISMRKAGEIVFGGGDTINLIKDLLRTNDLSGGPAFSLGILSLTFLAVVIIASFAANGNTTETTELLVPTLDVWGTPWPIYIFAITAFLVTVIVGLMMATKRAFDLDNHGLLQGWARETYLFRKDIKLPVMLALSVEFAILLSGLLIYALSQTAAVLVGAVYIPAICLAMGVAYQNWVKNDYVLVPWPRVKKEERPESPLLMADAATMSRPGTGAMVPYASLSRPNTSGAATNNDLEQAFHMIENLFGSQDNNNINNMQPKQRGVSPWVTTKPLSAGFTATTSDLVLNFDEEGQEDNGETHPETEGMDAKNDKVPTTLKGFSLPPLKVTGPKVEKEIKMPPLPLKSVLRRKRQNMGVKLQSQVPIVADLRARDGAPSADQFGNKAEDVFDVNDPWAQFEMTEEEELLQRKNKKKGVAVKQAKKEPNESFFRRVHRAIKKNPILNSIYYSVTGWFQYFQSNVKVYPSAYRPDFEQDYEASHDLEVMATANAAEEGEEGAEEGNTVGALTKALSKGLSKKDLANSLPKKPSGDDDDDEIVDVDKLTFSQAFWMGYLTKDEYLAWASWYIGLFLIMLFGITLGAAVRPKYLGYVVWMALWLFLLVYIPIYKYFQTYSFDATSKSMLYFAGFLHFMFCVCFFAVELNGDIGIVGSLWIFDFFIYYPIFTFILFSALQWVDSGFKLPAIDSNGDGSISMKEIMQFLQTFPALLAMVILFMWQLYVWINITVGLVFTLGMIISVIAYVYLKDWAENDQFLSPELVAFAKFMINFTMFISFCVAVFRAANPIFALSVFFFAWMGKYGLTLMNKVMMIDRDAVFYFSPFLFPIYSYDSSTQDVSEENDTAKGFLSVFLLATLWGCAMTIFFYPMHIGIAISCGLVLFGAALIILCISFIPRQLAKSQALIDAEIVKDSSELAKNKCDDRQLPLNLEMKNFESDLPDDLLTANGGNGNGQKSTLEKLKERTCLENCVAIMADLRSLKYVKEDPKRLEMEEQERAGEEVEDKDEYELTMWQKMVVQVKSYMRDLYELLPIHPYAGYRRHSQAPFGFKDLLLEIFFTGRGPFGVFGPEGLWLKFLSAMRETQHFKWMYGQWIDDYDALGNSRKVVQLEENLDYPSILARNLMIDQALDHTFKEETRCAVHFLLSVLVSADAKLQRETVLFQKFLRENRYRLAANGISPPRDIFSSESYASINIPLVAVWLSTLSLDEQSRFHTLKNTFNQEQRDRDLLITNSDADATTHAETIRQRHLQRDEEVMHRLNLELVQHRERRVQLFAESLDGPERVKFMQRKELWTHDYDCYVDMKDMDLYERFKEACLAERNEMLENAVHQLMEIEAAQRDIRLGEYGRSYQFVDSEFPPSEFSLGDGEGASYVLGWRCAPGIVENMQVFDGGTHPDDVCEGVFKNTWLLSAISMLLAASDFGKGLINERIRYLFVPHPSATDNELTLDTTVGAYCVRIYRNSEWIPVIVDDLLPMRRKEHWTNENRGMANAHCREGRGLWLPIIEKAFAKYYGTYSMLERGFVHHALEDLTGCEAECIPLSSYARGVHKRALWKTLLRYKRNGYILGAGTGEAILADRELQDMGICFNTAYTIYDVREVDGFKLLKLRNPPGDHDEWKGDWSDHSSLWTRRLQAKLGYHDDLHDNTFFMSFDDFVNVFRFLYTCKYYNPKKWIETKWNGFWKKPDESAVEQMDLMHQFLAEQADSISSAASKPAVDQESMNRKKAKARLNSAGGLPSKHNPGCILENNPHYSLRIHRPTDLNITVTQFNAKGVRSLFTPVPFAILVVQNDHPDVAKRLTSLRREDVLYSSGEPKLAKTQSLYVSSIKPGLYMVLVGAYLAGMEGHFSVSIRSNYRCEFLPVWPPAWMLRDDKTAASKAKDANKTGKPSLLDITESLEKSFGAGGGGMDGNGSQTGGADGISRANNVLRRGLKSLFGKGGEDDLDEVDLEHDQEEDDGPSSKR